MRNLATLRLESYNTKNNYTQSIFPRVYYMSVTTRSALLGVMKRGEGGEKQRELNSTCVRENAHHGTSRSI